jgi:hypothetical protein
VAIVMSVLQIKASDEYIFGKTQESDTWKWTEMYKGVRLMVYNELGYGV